MPEGIAAKEKRHLQYIIADQIERINYLIAQRAYGQIEDTILYSGLNSSMKALEAVVSPILAKPYLDKTRELKKVCDYYEGLLEEEFQNVKWITCFRPLMDWYSLLIKELRRLNMIPLEEIDIVMPHRTDPNDGMEVELDDEEQPTTEADAEIL